MVSVGNGGNCLKKDCGKKWCLWEKKWRDQCICTAVNGGVMLK